MKPILLLTFESIGNQNGTGVIINRLVTNLSANEIIHLGFKKVENAKTAVNFPTYILPYPNVHWRFEFLIRFLMIIPAFFLGLFLIVKYKPRTILAFYPYENTLILGYLLSLVSGIPLFAYLCDLYKENRKGILRKIANVIEPLVFKRSKKVIVVNEGMKRFYEEKGIETVSIFTSINETIPSSIDTKLPHLPYVIGYSGNVNNDRIDTFKTLIEAIGNNPKYVIRVFSASSKSEMEKAGVWANNIELSFINNPEKLVEELGKSHLLYLPLTFSTNNTPVEQLATCLGIKTYEYLVSGVPVLIQCPKKYYTAQFYQERNCGYVVDANCKDLLYKGIEKLLKDVDLRQELVNNSLKAALQFEGEKNANLLRKTIANSL